MDEHISLSASDKKKIADLEEEDEGEDEEDGNSDSKEIDAIIAQRNAYVKKCIKKAGISKSSSYKVKEKTEAVTEARRVLIKDLYSDMTKSKKCKDCGG